MDKVEGQPSDRELEVIAITKRELSAWENAQAFVTDRVVFNIGDLIRTCRKNYWGVFDEPFDKNGSERIWVPLTESIVESTVKNIDLDTKDINFRAKNPSRAGYTQLVRDTVRDALKHAGFGEALDLLERTIGIDGTGIWKTVEVYDKKEKRSRPVIMHVDRLNFFIDPSAKCIQEATCIERAVTTVAELKATPDLANTEFVEGSNTVERTDGHLKGMTGNSGEVKMIEQYERWGKLPKWVFTENREDEGEVEARALMSRDGSTWRLHLLEERKEDEYKPYEECWFTRVPNRWDGRGVAEKVMMLQLWMNIVSNTRRVRAQVSQLGLFKIRKGSGIKAQDLARLPVNGAITVSNMQDIESFVVPDASITSYKDEENILQWARFNTAAFETSTGESMPSTTTATAVATQSRSAASQFELIKEGIGLFLERWLTRHFIPIVLKNIKRGDILEHYPDSLQDYDEALVNKALYEELEKINASGQFIDPQQVEFERQRLTELLKQQPQRFVKVEDKKDLGDIDDYGVEVYITNEGFDKGVLAQNLLTSLQAAPEFKQQILTELFDLMGLHFKAPQQPIMPPGMPGQPGQVPPGTQDPTQLMTQANTGQAAGLGV